MYNYHRMKKVVCSILMMSVCSLALAQNYKLHPLFIYSFSRYIEWPEAYTQGNFEIVVLGESPITEELLTMAKMKKIGERPIVVTRINTLSEIKKCNVLFVPAAESKKQMKEILQKVGTQSILVITESAGMAQQGSCINFIIKEGKLAFELNQSALANQNLKATSELTRLAIII